MKLVNAKYGLSVEFRENKVNYLIVENQPALAEIVSELYTQVQGGEGNFILQQDNKEMKMAKCVDYILEPFSLSLNSKKYIGQLYAEMTEYCNDFKYELKSDVTQKIVQLVDEVWLDSAYDIVFDLDVSPEALFKAVNVRFHEEYTSLKEKLVQYISVVASLNTVSLIIFVHLRSYFSETEMQEIYETAFCHKMNLLFIESADKQRAENENYCIIDRDLCIIEA